MKILFKKSLSLVLACLMLLAVIPMTASAAKYENPEFKVSLLSETSSEVVVTLDLTSGKFNCFDLGFIAKSGYTCTKIAKGSTMADFVEVSEDNGAAVTFASNFKKALVSFASTNTYSGKGPVIKATFSKSGKSSYMPGDITVEFTNCALTEGSKSITLSPVVSDGSMEYEVVLYYHDTYKADTGNKKAKWSTDNKKVAIVNDQGEIHAGIKGNATITAIYDNYVVYYKVTVKFNLIQSLMYYIAFGFIWMKPESF